MRWCRRVLKVRKGDTMSEFLRKVRDQLAPDFREMRGAAVDQMLYIKEDLLIPHDFTFQWFILNKARGKSGPVRTPLHEAGRGEARAGAAGRGELRAWE